MKKAILIFLAILVGACPFVLFGCKEEEKQVNSYSMDLEYTPENQTLEGNMVIEYINSSDNSFKNLYFHLYPNAFRQDAKYKPVSQSSFTRAYPNGESYGNITINGVFCDGQEMPFEIGGEDLNILKVSLPCELFPDESVSVNIVFVVSLAQVNHRLGYGDGAVNFGNFYPVACVYENGVGFMTSPYSSNGDPFYSDVSNYFVSITYPREYVLASSGQVVESKNNENLTKSVVKGEKIRDFCFVLSKKFKVLTETVEGTKISYYSYNDPNPEHSLQTSCDALKTFNNLFGKYPYNTLSVVETNFVYGGMEYPNLVMITDTGDERDYVIVHEIAHQWWYGVVGNNQFAHPWQDESLTDYSAMLFFKENESYGEDYDTLIDGVTKSYKLYVELYTHLTGKCNTSMDRNLQQFQTEPEYVSCIYSKGVLLFDTLRETLGERRFLKILREYYKTYAYQNATPAQMIACFERASGVKLEEFFDSWLHENVVIL